MRENRVDVPNFKAVAAPNRVQALPTSDLNNITTVAKVLSRLCKPEKFGFGSVPPPLPLTSKAPPIKSRVYRSGMIYIRIYLRKQVTRDCLTCLRNSAQE